MVHVPQVFKFQGMIIDIIRGTPAIAATQQLSFSRFCINHERSRLVYKAWNKTKYPIDGTVQGSTLAQKSGALRLTVYHSLSTFD